MNKISRHFSDGEIKLEQYAFFRSIHIQTFSNFTDLISKY